MNHEPTPPETPEADAPLLDPAVSHRRRIRIMVTLVILLLLVGGNLAIGLGKLQFKRVVSDSMAPTLEVGDVILVDADALPERFDVVIVRDPESEDIPMVKRIIGMPGDRVVLVDGRLYLNGRLEESDQVTENHINWFDMEVTVPLDHYFVLGDNRNNSYDSLNYGPVNEHDVLGISGFIVWPLGERWGGIAPLHPEESP